MERKVTQRCSRKVVLFCFRSVGDQTDASDQVSKGTVFQCSMRRGYSHRCKKCLTIDKTHQQGRTKRNGHNKLRA
eukprot:scaffold1319_cov126-Cylindrotheca_fusiformis.AAC.25